MSKIIVKASCVCKIFVFIFHLCIQRRGSLLTSHNKKKSVDAKSTSPCESVLARVCFSPSQSEPRSRGQGLTQVCLRMAFHSPKVAISKYETTSIIRRMGFLKKDFLSMNFPLYESSFLVSFENSVFFFRSEWWIDLESILCVSRPNIDILDKFVYSFSAYLWIHGKSDVLASRNWNRQSKAEQTPWETFPSTRFGKRKEESSHHTLCKTLATSWYCKMLYNTQRRVFKGRHRSLTVHGSVKLCHFT